MLNQEWWQGGIFSDEISQLMKITFFRHWSTWCAGVKPWGMSVVIYLWMVSMCNMNGRCAVQTEGCNLQGQNKIPLLARWKSGVLLRPLLFICHPKLHHKNRASPVTYFSWGHPWWTRVSHSPTPPHILGCCRVDYWGKACLGMAAASHPLSSVSTWHWLVSFGYFLHCHLCL